MGSEQRLSGAGQPPHAAAPPVAVWRIGIISGLLAALAATAAMMFLRLAAQIHMPIELIAEWIPTVTPVSAHAGGIARFGESLKPLGYSLLLGGQLLLGTLWGVVVWRWRSQQQLTSRSRRTWLLAGGAPLLFWLVLTGFLPSVQNGGLELLSGLAGVVTFAVVLVAGQRALAGYFARRRPKPSAAGQAEQPRDRRSVFARAAWSVVLILGGIGLWQFLTRASRGGLLSMIGGPDSRGTRTEGVPSEITSIEDHYHVSKNFTDPDVDLAGWDLRLTGLVERPQTITYEQLRAMSSREKIHTLMCISNPVGGEFISTARWRGVPLKELLDRAGIGSGAREVVFHAADSYSDSIPIEKAMDPGCMVVWLMNGEQLPPAHGFPLRALIPDIYGMKNAKWITGIEVVDYDYRGFWQNRGWSDIATIKVMSRIDVPQSGQRVPTGKEQFIGGVSFAGDREVEQVEVSTDDGATWQAAQVRPALAPHAWSLWTLPWNPTPGTYALVVRATDDQGTTQLPEHTDALPDGADGWHRITVEVVEPPPDTPPPSG